MADPVRDFLGGDDGDLAIVNGDFAVVAGRAAVRQGIKTRLGLWKNECFLDEDAGVEYQNVIFAKPTDPLLVRAELERAILATPDVTNVVGAQLVDEGDRDSSINYAYDDIYSEDTLSEQAEVI